MKGRFTAASSGGSNSRSLSRVVRVSILSSVLATFAAPAWSTIVYNYAQDWMYDSTSGLYWQTQEIPTATFLPTSGKIATFQQLTGLWSDAAVPGYTFPSGSPTGTFSPQLANLLSFFESDTSVANPPNPALSLTVSEVYDYGITDPPPLNFEYWYLNYSSPSQTASGWSFVETTTIGDYDPGDACPAYLESCSAFEPAFVGSTTPPVPRPHRCGCSCQGPWSWHGSFAGLSMSPTLAPLRPETRVLRVDVELLNPWEWTS
jgi:hypothetical protein